MRDVLFPPICPGCREITGAEKTLCPACWPDLALLERGGCVHCGRPLPGEAPPGDEEACDSCLRHPPAWRRGAAAMLYEGVGRRLVLGLKHGDRLDTVPMLADWMARVGRDLIAEADLIAPVPLHWTRRLKRRGNQSAVLARALCRRVGQPQAFAPRLLVRTRATASQDGRNRAGRIANLAGALALGPGARVEGRGVLLIDDVLTTGATVCAGAEVLKTAGASHVDVLVLALVRRDDPAYIDPQPES